MSLITVMLYVSLFNGPQLETYQLKIGGLNATEMNDLKTIAAFNPTNSGKQEYGAWSVNFQMGVYADNTNPLMNLPPVHTVAPFISRIKSWGYKITFFDSYAGQIQFQDFHPDIMPLLSYTWMLEK